MATMCEFLTSGRLGTVQLGLRPEQVTQILGEPDDRSARSRPVLLLRYGSVELAFKPVPDSADSRLASVAVHFADPDRDVPPALRPTDWVPTHDTDEGELARFLQQESIQAHSRVDGEQSHLILATGASAAFRDGKLHSLHYRRGEQKVERQQVTVSLPTETVERLRRRAERERASVRHLIERVIEAGV